MRGKRVKQIRRDMVKKGVFGKGALRRAKKAYSQKRDINTH